MVKLIKSFISHHTRLLSCLQATTRLPLGIPNRDTSPRHTTATPHGSWLMVHDPWLVDFVCSKRKHRCAENEDTMRCTNTRCNQHHAPGHLPQGKEQHARRVQSHQQTADKPRRSRAKMATQPHLAILGSTCKYSHKPLTHHVLPCVLKPSNLRPSRSDHPAPPPPPRDR